MAKIPRTPTDAADRPVRKAGRPTSAKPRPPRQPKSKPAETRQAASETHAEPAAEPTEATPNQAELIEALSMNLAKAAMMAQSAIAEAALTQADRPAALSADPFNVAPAIASSIRSPAARSRWRVSTG